MQLQKQPAWCWAAVGICCAQFYDSADTTKQCELAKDSLQDSSAPPGNCCDQPIDASCNQEWYLENSEATKGAFVTLGIADGYVEGAVSAEKLAKDLAQNKLIAFRIKIPISGLYVYHFVVVSKIDTEHNQVTIHDSIAGTTRMYYSEFVDNYRGGTVTHSFFTKSKSA